MENTIYLNYINILHERIESKTRFIQVILGPRQVGKTTTTLKLIEENYKNKAHYASADKVFSSTPEWVREQWLEASSSGKILFIDEIQKVDNWAEAIKSLYDQSKRDKKHVTCVLLGSSSLEIQQGLSESLTGRHQLIRAYHWNFEESKRGYDFSFDDYLSYGGYPGSYELVNGDGWRDYVKNSIIKTVVERDILQYRTVRNPALFKQAFEILVSYPAQEISYTKLLGQLQEKGNVELIKYYISLYEGAFLIKTLEKYSNKNHLRRTSSPKILPLAPCLSQIANIATDKSDFEGRIFELIVGSQLVRTGCDIYYWREGQQEVDFVLEADNKIFAIEVKSGRKKGTKGLTQFKKNFPSAMLALIDKEKYCEFEKDPISFLKLNSI